jgi:hypothetical protein
VLAGGRIDTFSLRRSYPCRCYKNGEMSRSTWLLMAAVVFSVLSCTFAVSLSEREAAKSKEALSAPEMHGGAVADVRGTDSSPEPDVLGVRESDDDGDGDGYEDVQEDTTDDHRREDDETAVDESQPEDDAKAGDDSLDSASEGVPPMQEEHVYFASIDLDHGEQSLHLSPLSGWLACWLKSTLSSSEPPPPPPPKSSVRSCD